MHGLWLDFVEVMWVKLESPHLLALGQLVPVVEIIVILVTLRVWSVAHVLRRSISQWIVRNLVLQLVILASIAAPVLCVLCELLVLGRVVLGLSRESVIASRILVIVLTIVVLLIVVILVVIVIVVVVVLDGWQLSGSCTGRRASPISSLLRRACRFWLGTEQIFR